MNVKQKIIELYKQGHTKDYIAKQVGLLPSHIDDVISSVEIDVARVDFEDFTDFANRLEDADAFIKGLVSLVGFRALEILKSGEIEEIVNGSVRSEPRVLKRKLDAKDLKMLVETIEKAKGVLGDKSVDGVLDRLKTLSVEFIDKCENESS